jgi:hypothetical protein
MPMSCGTGLKAMRNSVLPILGSTSFNITLTITSAIKRPIMDIKLFIKGIISRQTPQPNSTILFILLS